MTIDKLQDEPQDELQRGDKRSKPNREFALKLSYPCRGRVKT